MTADANGADQSSRGLYAVLSLASSAWLGLIGWMINQVATADFYDVRRLLIFGAVLLVIDLLSLVYFVERGRVLTARQRRHLFATTFPLIAALVGVRFVSGWHQVIVLGALALSFSFWVFRCLGFLLKARAPETPSRIEAVVGEGFTRLGNSLLHVGGPFVDLGRKFAGGAAVVVCTFVASLMFVTLGSVQAASVAYQFVHGHPAQKKQRHYDNKKKKKKKKNETPRKKSATKGKRGSGGPSTGKPVVPPPAPPSNQPAPSSNLAEETWRGICGADSPYPGYDRSPLEAAKWQELFYGPGQPGAPGSGCTGKTEPVPGHPGVRYLVGLNSAGDTQSIGIVWRTGTHSYDGALVIAPATKVFWQLVLKYGRLHAQWRVNVGNGDLVWITSRAGTTLLIRSTKTLHDGDATPYVRLNPPAANLWIEAVEKHREWLWPVPSESPRGTRSFVLVHDPVLREEVARISYDTRDTSGSYISLKRITRYAPVPQKPEKQLPG